MIPLLALLRPKQWIKNGLVVTPLIFSFHFALSDIRSAILAVMAFCAASSTIYIVNDITDAGSDQQHPQKRTRPIASGQVRIGPAIVLALGLLLLSIGLSMLISYPFVWTILAYTALNVVYSLILKRMVIIDVMAIALGFVLRVVGGALAIQVLVSHWIIICTFFVSLFIGFAKRKNENDVLKNTSRAHRAVLLHYTPDFLHQLIGLTAGMSIIAYALYTIDHETIQRFGTDRLIYTLPFVVYGIFRYFYLIYNTNQSGDPTQIFLKDKALILTILGWLACFIVIVLTRHG